MSEFDHREVDVLFDNLRGVGPIALQYMGLDLWAVSTKEAPHRRGTLQGSIQPTQQEDYQWIIGTDLEYALYVHEGTSPHVIEAKDAQALGPFQFSSYMGVRIGGYVNNKKAKLDNSNLGFYKKVHHPGTAPNPFFDRAIEIVEDRTDEYITMATEGIG